MRRFAGKDLLHQRIVTTKSLGKIDERICESKNLVIIVDRFAGEKLQLERFFRAIAKCRDPFAVWFGALVDRTGQ